MKGIHDLRGRKFVGKSRRTTFRASLGQFGQKKQKICMAATPMIQVTFFFLSWPTCAYRGDFCEWSYCDFSSANSIYILQTQLRSFVLCSD